MKWPILGMALAVVRRRESVARTAGGGGSSASRACARCGSARGSASGAARALARACAIARWASVRTGPSHTSTLAGAHAAGGRWRRERVAARRRVRARRRARSRRPRRATPTPSRRRATSRARLATVTTTGCARGSRRPVGHDVVGEHAAVVHRQQHRRALGAAGVERARGAVEAEQQLAVGRPGRRTPPGRRARSARVRTGSAKVVVTVLTPRASSAPLTQPASRRSRCSASGLARRVHDHARADRDADAGVGHLRARRASRRVPPWHRRARTAAVACARAADLPPRALPAPRPADRDDAFGAAHDLDLLGRRARAGDDGRRAARRRRRAAPRARRGLRPRAAGAQRRSRRRHRRSAARSTTVWPARAVRRRPRPAARGAARLAAAQRRAASRARCRTPPAARPAPRRGARRAPSRRAPPRWAARCARRSRCRCGRRHRAVDEAAGGALPGRRRARAARRSSGCARLRPSRASAAPRATPSPSPSPWCAPSARPGDAESADGRRRQQPDRHRRIDEMVVDLVRLGARRWRAPRSRWPTPAPRSACRRAAAPGARRAARRARSATRSCRGTGPRWRRPRSTLAGAATSAVTASAACGSCVTSAALARERQRPPLADLDLVVRDLRAAAGRHRDAGEVELVQRLDHLALRESCGCSGPAAGPTRRPGSGRTGARWSTNGNACSTPPRSHVELDLGRRRWPRCAARRRARGSAGACVKSFVTGAPMRRTPVAGTVLVSVIENSTTTTNGRVDEPSGVLCSPLLGSVPVFVITRVRARLAAVGGVEVLGDERRRAESGSRLRLVAIRRTRTSARSGRPRT